MRKKQKTEEFSAIKKISEKICRTNEEIRREADRLENRARRREEQFRKINRNYRLLNSLSDQENKYVAMGSKLSDFVIKCFPLPEGIQNDPVYDKLEFLSLGAFCPYSERKIINPELRKVDSNSFEGESVTKWADRELVSIGQRKMKEK